MATRPLQLTCTGRNTTAAAVLGVVCVWGGGGGRGVSKLMMTGST